MQSVFTVNCCGSFYPRRLDLGAMGPQPTRVPLLRVSRILDSFRIALQSCTYRLISSVGVCCGSVILCSRFWSFVVRIQMSLGDSVIDGLKLTDWMEVPMAFPVHGVTGENKSDDVILYATSSFIRNIVYLLFYCRKILETF